MFNNLKKLISLVFATVLLTSISSTSFAIDKLHLLSVVVLVVVGMELLEELVKL